ncbi:hypothetical protein Taro_036407 [Colocasia esculenta]|uniref:Glycosyltransferase n=1 Tax=Colocasia esculenta TaxID=4460 RepID=A0A843WLK2_COLES|nr:hypothetical protein [Colocasia esculenta]
MAAMAADAIGSEPPAPAAGTLPHAAIFPFMSKGHTIPLLHLARLLHRRRLATFTFFTTPLNAPFIRASLDDLLPLPAVVELPFPRDAPGLSPGVESTDQLPSMSDFNAFCRATERLREPFERALAALQPPAAFLVSDSFHFCTADSAAAFGIPRLVFDGMGWFARTVSSLVGIGRPHAGLNSDVQPFQVPGFPQIWITKADFPPPLDDPDSRSPEKDFILEVIEATAKSRGIIGNSFHDMEAAFSEHWNRHFPTKGWSVGPLCLAALAPEAPSLPAKYAEWLDARLAAGRPVLYVSFGTQAEISPQQLQELAAALENSGLDFFWVVRPKDGAAAGAQFEERVAGKGLVTREWIPQVGALCHGAVRGFLSHCGWNSVLESVCAGVPILAWPIMADQHLNAKLVVEELGLGLRLQSADGRRGGLVTRERIEEWARELLLGPKGMEAATKIAELSVAARRAMEQGGSSWCSLEELVKEVCGEKELRRPANGPSQVPAAAIAG